MATLKKTKLVGAANELNDLLGLDPQIDTSQDADAIEELLRQAIPHLEEDDALSKETQKVVDKLNATTPEDDGDEDEEKSSKKKKKKKSKSKSDDSGESKSTDDETAKIIKKVKKNKKLDDLKATARTHSVFSKIQEKLEDYSGLEGTKQLKADMLKALGVEDTGGGSKGGSSKGKSSGAKKPEKKEKQPSPFGTTVELLCEDPDMDRKQLIKKLEKKGFDVEASRSAIQTGISSVNKIVKLLRENGHMKKKK